MVGGQDNVRSCIKELQHQEGWEPLLWTVYGLCNPHNVLHRPNYHLLSICEELRISNTDKVGQVYTDLPRGNITFKSRVISHLLPPPPRYHIGEHHCIDAHGEWVHNVTSWGPGGRTSFLIHWGFAFCGDGVYSAFREILPFTLTSTSSEAYLLLGLDNHTELCAVNRH